MKCDNNSIETIYNRINSRCTEAESSHDNNVSTAKPPSNESNCTLPPSVATQGLPPLYESFSVNEKKECCIGEPDANNEKASLYAQKSY